MSEREKNARLILDVLHNSEIESSALHIGILCVTAKECGLIPKTERGYGNTSNTRIKQIFGKKTLGEYYDDDKMLSELKQNDRYFFNVVYRDRGGNRAPEDGYRYRGRGFNQLTFLGNYRRYSPEGVDLVKHPCRVNEPGIAAQVLVNYFEDQLIRHHDTLLERYNVSPQTIRDTEKAVMMIANVNAGIGRARTSGSVQRAWKNAMHFLDEMIEFYNCWWYDNEKLVKEFKDYEIHGK